MLAFAVVAIGGMGSIEGALIGALIVGLCRAAAVHLVPQVELFVIYAVMALVLAVRPHGLFTQPAAAKNLSMTNPRHPARCAGLPGGGGVGAVSAAVARLAQHHRVCQRAGRARPR